MIIVPEAKFDLRFEISNLNYTGMHVYVANLVASEAMAASEVTYDLRFELSDLNQLCSHAFLAFKCFPEKIDMSPRPIMIH